MSADPDHSMGQPAHDRALDWEMADLPVPEEPGWYADDARAIDEPAWETPDPSDPPWETPIPATRPGRPPISATRSGTPLTSTTRPTGARLRAPRSLMVAGLTPSRLTRSWPRWSTSSSAMGWTSWMMTS